MGKTFKRSIKTIAVLIEIKIDKQTLCLKGIKNDRQMLKERQIYVERKIDRC